MSEIRSFDEVLKEFVAYCEKIVENHRSAMCPTLPKEDITVTIGKRYARLIKNHSAYCFVDSTNGDILKTAGWNTPAKGARGNIYRPETWVAMSPYGAAYLR